MAAGDLNRDGFADVVVTTGGQAEGRVAIYGTLEVPANAAGKSEEFELKVYYQPCDEQRCLKPETVVLRGKLKVAGPGETVKQINQNLFPKENRR